MNSDTRELPLQTLLTLAGALALVAGVYARFVGLGAWPLGVDEFYISRSVDNVLRSGLPAFPCGGYYNRGLAYQYVVAALRWCGMGTELAARLPPAISSLLVLPAAYRLGRRLEGPLAGWLTVIILLVSIWEIEMARFGRMYAPFQAVFAWYLVHFVRYTVDRDARAMKWLIGLSVLGVLTWEGGALLGAANVLAVLGWRRGVRLTAADWLRVGGLVLLLVVLFLATRDLRGYATVPGTIDDAPPAGHLQALQAWLAALRAHPPWAAASMIPVALALAALPALRAYAARPLAAAGLVVALAAAALHLFVVCFGVLALLLLTGLLPRRGALSALAPRYGLAIAAFLIFWTAFEHWVVPRGSMPGGPGLLADLFGFPDVYDVVMRPWGRTLPLLSVALGLAVLYSAVRATDLAADAAPEPLGVLLSVLCLMVLAVGASSTDRLETRYTFFLYPLLIALAVAALLHLTRARAAHGLGLAGLAALPLVCFAAGEDFQPQHLVNVDTAAVTFRVGMSPARAAHYYPRNDMRVVAEWLKVHAAPGDVVASGIPNLDQYYHRVDYFFLDDEDPRYEAFVCADGRIERWGGRRVLYTAHALAPVVASGRRVLVTVWPDAEAHLQQAAAAEGWSVTRLWQTEYGNTRVLLIAAKPRF